MCWVSVLAIALAARAAAGQADNVTVARLQLAMDEEHTLQVDSTIEYILHFVPTPEQSAFPSRVWVRSGGGDAARPLLVTARQRTGAITWQLPYYSEKSLLFELERTLCPDDSSEAESSDCAEEAGAPAWGGEFSLHVSSACAAPFAVTLRAAAARDWHIRREAVTSLTVSQAAPRVHYYRFGEEDSIRLVVASADDVCAVVAVQTYTCPIAEALDDIESSTTRMTVQRSGAVQLSKERYPRGFYVIAVLSDSDSACTGEEAEGEDWLWEAAVGLSRGDRGDDAQPARVKRLTLEMRAALTRGEYLVGAAALLALFLLFYVAFGALALAARWPPWARLVAPRAVLAAPASEAGGLTAPGRAGDAAAARRRRRDSDATFDSSDISDSESDSDGASAATAATAATPPAPRAAHAAPVGASPEAPPGADGGIATIELHDDARRDVLDGNEDQNGFALTVEAVAAAAAAAATARQPAAGEADAAAARPFGLPARLHVAALARRRGRVLRARSDRYLYALYTVAVFYSLPVVQFVAAFQMFLNVSGSLDTCYYNFLCAHPLGALSDFNHVLSNLGYLLLGALFMLQLRRRRLRRKREPRDEEYGIPQHYGLLSSLGAGMMVVALLSASYHVCPNRLNFQFDTAFMYVLAVLLMVKIYQARHPDINARAHATFGVLAVLIALVVWGMLGGGPLFWSIFTVIHVFTILLLSLRIYYVGQFRLEKESLAETARSMRAGAARPLYTQRLVALLVANAVNWAFALYGYAWAWLGGAALCWAPAMYYFTAGSSNSSQTPAVSRHANHECRVLRFYDAHDLWHVLSAVALYCTFNAVLTWDDGLSAVKRTEIAVF